MIFQMSMCMGGISLISRLLTKIQEVWCMLGQYPIFKRRTFLLESIKEVGDFAITRSAFIAQKTMFGYVKTRMGTSYPEMFRDDLMVESLKEATMHHYSACLSDLTIFVLKALVDQRFLDCSTAEKYALLIFRKGLEMNTNPSLKRFKIDDACASFEARIRVFAWPEQLDPFVLFRESPRSLGKWAPIADEFKRLDQEIAENSVSFAWIEVRREFYDLLHWQDREL